MRNNWHLYPGPVLLNLKACLSLAWGYKYLQCPLIPDDEGHISLLCPMAAFIWRERVRFKKGSLCSPRPLPGLRLKAEPEPSPMPRSETEFSEDRVESRLQEKLFSPILGPPVASHALPVVSAEVGGEGSTIGWSCQS